MADNTTTYTAVIETEVKGGEDIEKLGDDAEGAADGFVKLQLQIRQTQKDLQAAASAGDKVKFNKLKAQLDDLEDGLEKVQLQSKQFEDQLAGLPGPAGAAGNAIKGVDSAFKILIANPIIAVIAAIGGALLLMKKALSSTAEGQQTLNRLSQAFSAILGPILATVEKVAVPLFNGFAFVLEKVAAGFSKFAKFLGISESKIKEATLSVDEVQQKANENEKKRQEDLTKKTEEQNKKRAELNAKAAADKKKKEEEAEAARKKKEEEAQKNLDAANKVQVEAYISTLAARDQELFKLGQLHNERMASLQKAGITDTLMIQEQFRIEQDAINKKYDDEAAKKVEEEKKKKEEDDKKKVEEDKAKVDKKREDDLLGLQTELEFSTLSAQQRKDLISQQEAVLLTNAELTENQKTAIQKQAAAQRKAIDEAELDNKRDIQLAQIDLVGQFGGLLQQIAGKNKKVAIAGIVIEQAAAIAKIIANTAIANAKSVAAFPITGGMPWVAINTISAGLSIASTIASAAKSISAINSSDNATSAQAGTSNLPKGGMSAPVAPSVAGVSAPVIQGTQSATPGEQIAGTLAAVTGKPMKAYVVSGDISSQQALDRRTSNSATFGGY
jgi:myosin heavy subunit